ncbi:hypothetical protein niasHS_001815 [Heterodera schachtii]|uniref:Uncharacterized protein n=1 Tax=Heterodera schachtii TaxID=97005 RepID=A0ABD2KAT9_HETSC
MCIIWQISTDQTVHLTDGGGGFKEVKILTLAQCHANNGSKQTATKTYGIEFRLPRKGEICDDGYPLGAGQLKISVLFASNQTAVPFIRFSLEENDFDGRAMQNDFLRSNGPSFLADYADLWLLGIDMLPMAHQTEEQREQLKMELFIHRSSKCFMEAWFVQPSHSLDPSDPKMQLAFSLCKPNPTEKQNEWLFPKKVDKYVLPTGGGCLGLGNQMFRFAALYGIGKPYGRKPIYKNIDKCKKSHVNAVEKGEKKEQGDGCFQSYKFFESRKTEIRQIFQFGNQLCMNVTQFKNEFFGNDQSHKFCVHIRRGDFVKRGWDSKKEPTEKGIDFGFEYLKGKFENISISVVLLGEDKQFLANLSFNQQTSTFAWWIAYLMPDNATIFYNSDFLPGLHTRNHFLPEWIPIKLINGTMTLD